MFLTFISELINVFYFSVIFQLKVGCFNDSPLTLGVAGTARLVSVGPSVSLTAINAAFESSIAT